MGCLTQRVTPGQNQHLNLLTGGSCYRLGLPEGRGLQEGAGLHTYTSCPPQTEEAAVSNEPISSKRSLTLLVEHVTLT